MVHGKDDDQIHRRIAEIAELTGSACRAHDVIFSQKILKKTGLRLAPGRG